MQNYLILSVLTFLAFILPSIFFGLLNEFYNVRLEMNFLLAFIPAALIFPLVKPRILSIIIFLMFALIEIIQLSHLLYFKTPLNVYAIALMLEEWAEVFDSASVVMVDGVLQIFFVCAVYGILIYAYYKSTIKTHYIATILIIIMLSILPYKALYKTPRLSNFDVSNDGVSLYNGLKTFNAYAFIYSKNTQKTLPTFEEYSVQFQESNTKENFILILGESVNANHIGILGYQRNTTPLLQQMQGQDFFLAKNGISSGVSTRVSLPSFMNIAYHPQNILHIVSEKTHLVKLAKMAGYKTFYISNQTQSEASSMSPNYLDVILTRENFYKKSRDIGDLTLLEWLNRNITTLKDGKNFVILHQRNPHSPYENGYKGYPQAKVFPTQEGNEIQRRINSYDNALIFNDYLLAEVFKSFKWLVENGGAKTRLLFVPDHGEAMGEKNPKSGLNEFGHSFLSKNVANIPIFYQSYGYQDDPFYQYLDEITAPTHYEIAMQIAKTFGYSIHNPHYQEGIFYINGSEINGRNGFMKVKKHPDSIEYLYK